MNQKELANVRHTLEAHCGIHIPPEKNDFLCSRLELRMRAIGISTPVDYLNHLFEQEGGELHELINLLTVNETYFYRHKEQFAILRSIIWDRLQQRGGRPLTIWCAACSVGAEPYSIAILLQEMQLPPDATVKILATDIDTGALTQARAGWFSERCVTAELPSAYKERYFTRDADGYYRLRDSVRSQVLFRQQNLRTGLYPSEVDIIFCRNAMIYFREAARAEIIRKFYGALAEDGHIFLSPMESLADWRAHFREQGGAGGCKCYRKWTTDRRAYLDDDGRFGDQRHQLDYYPAPAVEVAGQDVVVSGIIDGEQRIHTVENALRLAVARMPAGRPWQIDLRKVRYITNDGLARLGGVLSEGTRAGHRPERLQVANECAREIFTAAGFSSFGRVVVAGPAATAAVVSGAGRQPAGLSGGQRPAGTGSQRSHTAPGGTNEKTKRPQQASAARLLPPREMVSLALPARLDAAAVADFESGISAALTEWCAKATAGRDLTIRLDLRPAASIPDTIIIVIKRFIVACPDSLRARIICREEQSVSLRQYQIPVELMVIGQDSASDTVPAAWQLSEGLSS